jgi:predicted acylesterase/phospholipase RssA
VEPQSFADRGEVAAAVFDKGGASRLGFKRSSNEDGIVDALVFSGGGARGAYQIGVSEALQERGFRPELVTGTSVGAIPATLVAEGALPQRLESLWLDICEPGFLPLQKDFYRIHRWNHLRDNDKLEALLEQRVDWEAVHQSSTELRFTAVDIQIGERVLFGNHSASPRAVLASTASPRVFEPQEVDGRVLWDGGLLTSTPLQPAIEEGAREIYAILNEPMGRALQQPPSTLQEGLDRVVEIVNERALRRHLERAREINELVRNGQAADYWHLIHFHLIALEDRLDVHSLSFDADQARRLWNCGYDDAGLVLDGLHEDQQALASFGAGEDKG